MRAPAILQEDDISRARRAFITFQGSLDNLEQEMKPLEEDMSPALKVHLASLSSIARVFFWQANQELFSPYQRGEQVTLTTKEDGIRENQQ